MAIIKQYHKDTDTTYVYESASYWDADKKQSRSKRKLLGKLDSETGEVIPTGSRGRKHKETPASSDNRIDAEAREKDERIRKLTIALAQKDAQIIRLEQKNYRLQEIIKLISKHIDQCREICLTDAAERR
jgi:predicted RNase H-like nuclease (RuvC/YqgF family)